MNIKDFEKNIKEDGFSAVQYGDVTLFEHGYDVKGFYDPKKDAVYSDIPGYFKKFGGTVLDVKDVVNQFKEEMNRLIDDMNKKDPVAVMQSFVMEYGNEQKKIDNRYFGNYESGLMIAAADYQKDPDKVMKAMKDIAQKYDYVFDGFEGQKTNAWEGNIPVFINDFDMAKYESYCNKDQYSYQQVSDLLENEGYVQLDVLNDKAKSEILESILDGYGNGFGDFSYDVYGVECYDQAGNKVDFMDLSEKAIENVLQDMCNGQTSGKIVDDGQSLTEKLEAAGKAVSCAEKAVEKDIER